MVSSRRCNAVTSEMAFLVVVSLVTLWTTVRGRQGDDNDSGPAAAWPKTAAAVVCDTITVLEKKSSSLSKGVMVVATDWSADGDVPPGLLWTLQARHVQPVYTADVDHLLADGRDAGTDGHGEDALPALCRHPATAAERGRAPLLPLSARYVVLFRGRGPSDSFDALAGLNYTFWNVNIYYLIVVPDFDLTVRQMVYGLWHNLSIYKVIVITPTAIKILDPFVRNAVDGRFSNVPLRSTRRVPAVLKSRIKNLQLFPLRFVINQRPPTVIATTDNGGGGRGRLAYVGQDGTFAALLAAKMNATPVYISELSDKGKIYYGYKRSGTRTYGTFAGVIDGRADVSANGHFVKDYNCYTAELTRHVRLR